MELILILVPVPNNSIVIAETRGTGNSSNKQNSGVKYAQRRVTAATLTNIKRFKESGKYQTRRPPVLPHSGYGLGLYWIIAKLQPTGR